jgi:hypothetical protein
MKHIIKFEKFKINEFVDFERDFDIDEEVLSYTFSELIDKYPYLGIRLVGNDDKSFKVELYDKQPSDKNHDLKDEFDFLKTDKIYNQIKAHFDTMDFSIKKCEYNRDRNIISLEIQKLI